MVDGGLPWESVLPAAVLAVHALNVLERNIEEVGGDCRVASDEYGSGKSVSCLNCVWMRGGVLLYHVVDVLGLSGSDGRSSVEQIGIQAVSRNSKTSGVMSMWNSILSTLASRDKVASDGSWSPASRRAIADWCI